MKFFSFALEIERHRKKLGIHGADPEAMEKRFKEYIDKHETKEPKDTPPAERKAPSFFDL